MDAFNGDPLVQSITAYAKDYMKNYDASHSWDHIERVVAMAHHIYTNSDILQSTLDLRTIHLAALLHDVGDRKYLRPNEDPTTVVTAVLLSHGATPELASYIQTICSNVSYTTETTHADAAHMTALLASHPELAVVQDADRLDAMGAVGIGRMFAYGGAKTTRGLADTMRHLDEKLVRLEELMKTAVGRGVARRRGERLAVFRGWWAEEVGEGLG
ncbi:hypothetical protein BT67DRAFT_451782 [Trichocladium antarcticum]|uniref:HD/PDEase domain-containing protein n=1 Tax=Trichocladium antarcticum TaxID=1450529 RepID=A0AAN6UET8_9PEZI|nr:hypothetical protein BT67DRAFT_451782 [Trichocladium antarcticum]